MNLIEMLISLTVIGILSTFTLFSYQPYLTKSYRLNAELSLQKLALALTEYFTEYNSFADVSLEKLKITDPKNYLLEININENNYTLLATPTRAQARRDANCATLTLNSQGEKGQSGPGKLSECW